MSASSGAADGADEPDGVASPDEMSVDVPESATSVPADAEPQVGAVDATPGSDAEAVVGPGKKRSSHPEAVRPQGDAEAKRKPWWQHAWAIFGAVVGLVGAVTGVIGVLPILVRDATNPESLTVSLQPADAALVSTFAIPVTTDWSDFPSSASGCTAEQQTWLESMGVLLHERYLVTVGNTAAEGATLSLKDFRGKGQAASTPVQSVAVVCDRSGTGEFGMRAARLDPASGRTAVYEQQDPSLPDNPLVFNLTPGESGDFGLFVQSSADFTGEIVFTASLGGDSWPVTLPVEGGIKVPGVAAQRLTVAGDRLACVGDDDCDPVNVIAEVLAASGRG